MNKFVFTFSHHSSLRDCYVVLMTECEQDAKHLMYMMYGALWAYCFTFEQFISEPRKSGLTEVPFGTPVTLM